MSAYTKRKHVTKEVEEFDDLPTDKSIVKIISGRGNNLHLVKTDNGEEYLASMPTKFRKHVWVKRGDFVLVEPIVEGDKVKAEISHILLKTHIKQLKKEGKWPKQFDDTVESKIVIDDDVDEYSSDDSSLNLEENPNRANHRLVVAEESEYDSSSDEDENTSEDEESSVEKETE